MAEDRYLIASGGNIVTDTWAATALQAANNEPDGLLGPGEADTGHIAGVSPLNLHGGSFPIIGAIVGHDYTGTFTLATGEATINGDMSGTLSPTVVGSGVLTCGGNITFGAATNFASTLTLKMAQASEGAYTLAPGGTMPMIVLTNAAATSLTVNEHLTAISLTSAVLDSKLTMAAGKSVTLSGALTQSNGTITLASGTTNTFGSFTRTNGTFNDNGSTVRVAGNIALAAGTGSLTMTGTWETTGVGNLSGTTSGKPFPRLNVNGTTTFTGSACVVRVLGGSGTIASGSQLSCVPYATSFWQFTGTCSTNVLIETSLSLSTGNAITVNNANLTFNLGLTVTLSGAVATGTGTVQVKGTGAGTTGTLDCVGGGIAAARVIVGDATTATRSGVVKFRNHRHRTGSGGMARANAGDAGCRAELDSSYIESAGVIDFAGMTVTNVAARIIGGTVSNCPATGSAEKIHCHGTIDGGGNDAASIDFDTEAPVGSLGLCGAGA